MQGKAKTLFNRKSFSNWVLNYALYVVLCAMILYVVIKNPNFLFQSSFPYINFTNILNILTQASTRGIMALGVAGLIVLQGTDLSAGRIVGICGIVSASLLQAVDFGARMYEKLPWDNSNTFVTVSYTHLDVYKRQHKYSSFISNGLRINMLKLNRIF